MRMAAQAEKRSYSGKQVFVGIDVHKESWHLTVRSSGEEIFNGRIPGQYQSLRRILDRYHDARIKVAYEAGPFGFWLLDRLTRDGVETIVVPPSLIPSNRVTRSKQTRGTVASWLRSWRATCSSTFMC